MFTIFDQTTSFYLEEGIDIAHRRDVVRNERFQLVVEDYCLGAVLGDVPKQIAHLSHRLKKLF